jgi:uncharacterized Zn-finger protein
MNQPYQDYDPQNPFAQAHLAVASQFSLQYLIPFEQDTNKKYKCRLCDRSFSKLYNLRSHEKTHDDVKPFSCSVCDLKFARKHDLTRHFKTHEQSKPFTCENCKKQFSRRDALRRHERMNPVGKLSYCVAPGSTGVDRGQEVTMSEYPFPDSFL